MKDIWNSETQAKLEKELDHYKWLVNHTCNKMTQAKTISKLKADNDKKEQTIQAKEKSKNGFIKLYSDSQLEIEQLEQTIAKLKKEKRVLQDEIAYLVKDSYAEGEMI